LIKIIAVLNSTIGSGGGFDQALNAILQMQRLSNDHFDFEVFTTKEKNLDFLNKIGIKAIVNKYTFIDRIISVLSQNLIWQIVQKKFKFIGPFERKLLQHGCDIVYYVTPGYFCSALQRLNYINTMWDLCHRENPEFPEVREYNVFAIRDYYHKVNYCSALVTLTDSDQLSDLAAHSYGIARNRFISMPFSPSSLLGNQHSIKKEDVLIKYKLEAGYFYYPAQFWPHKNHIRILQALKILREENGWRPTVVFSGKDYGNLNYLKRYISQSELDTQVRIVDFVPSEDVRGLYENASAIVMPTYFGPTNIPPLEAWSLNVPLIYSAHLVQQVGNAALLVDPDSARELASLMLQSMQPEIRERLIIAGHQRLNEIDGQRKLAEDSLFLLLAKFAARRQCWH
jgi:glycosyltransferase involved in cell wall biosynthesis